jgi:type II secretory pathway component GspD/PulD (secretin)
MLLAIAIVLASWQKTEAAEQPSPSTAVNGEGAAVQKKRPRQQILLDVHVMTMNPRDHSKLGSWRRVTLRDDESAVSPVTRTGRSKTRKPIEAQVLCASDPVATESLLAKMKNLEENGCLYVLTNPALIVQDGREALLKSIRNEWFLMWDPQPDYGCCIRGAEIWVCPAVSMTAHVGENNDITILSAFEVSNRDLIRHLHHPDSEIVSQRSETHSITLKDGGTMAWVGLVPCDAKNERRSGLGQLPLVGGLLRGRQAAKRTRETVIFVTAQIIPEFTPTIIPGHDS